MRHKSVIILSLISILISIFGILVYEFKLPGLSFNNIEGWDKCALALSYSVIGGWIIFILTCGMPYILKKNRNQKLIQEHLLQLNKELSSILEKYCSANNEILSNINIKYINISIGHQSENIIHNSSFCNILNNINWNSIFDEQNNITYRTQILATVKKIISTITQLDSLYDDYLSDNQQRCFNTILNIPLQNNWAFNKLGNTSNRIDLINLILQISDPLQKSIGIALPKDINQILPNNMESNIYSNNRTNKYLHFYKYICSLCVKQRHYIYLKIKDNRVYYFLSKNLFWILLIFSIILIIWLTFFKLRIHINFITEDQAKSFNDLLLTFACSYVCGWIIFIVTEKLPFISRDQARKKYVKTQLKEIEKELRSQIITSKILCFNDENQNEMEGFIKYYLKFNGTSYNRFYKSCKNVVEISTILLRDFGNYLNYDEIKKLEFIKDYYNVTEPAKEFWQYESDTKKYDENVLSLQAIDIYKAYQVIIARKYFIPKYPKEDIHRRKIMEIYGV